MALTEKRRHLPLQNEKAKIIKKRLFWLDALKKLHLRQVRV